MFKKVFYVDVFLYPHDDWQKSLHTKKFLIGFWFDNLATSVCIWIKIFVLSDWVQEQHYETFSKISPFPEKKIFPQKMHALNYFEHVTAATHISISFFLLIYFLHEYIDILLITN